MGCRTVNGFDVNAFDNFKNNIQHIINGEYDKVDDVFSAVQKDGRGNICPVTIILPTLAAVTRRKLEKKGVERVDENNEVYFAEFMKLLDLKIHEAKDTLLERMAHISKQSRKSARFMYDNHTMTGYHENEGIFSALKHGTLVIGQLGMSEALMLLIGKDQTTDEGMKYAIEIENLYNQRCAEFKKEYSLNFGVYYTPAENLCYTAFNKFRKAFPEYDIENVTYYIDNDKKIYKEYFTNSTHVPVYHDCDPFEKINIESKLTKLSNAGCITYVELPSTSFNNIEAVETLVDYAMDNDIPYFALNFPLTRCANPECNKPILDENAECCPFCGHDKLIRLGRITGYLSTTIEHFNKGKQAEFHQRLDHTDKNIEHKSL